MKSINYRIPADIIEDLLVELEFKKTTGQQLVDELLWEYLNSTNRLEKNAYSKSRDDIRKQMFKKPQKPRREKALGA